ncbi:Shedu immune nuclease family protein (plasmid) [Ralstonia sp. R-29]|uniref:Shedu immune nuclease family protein n=1 Tax=Ralstonia sp. R-29 TaxID=3404059 RepID=UPI003CE77895
MARSVVQSLDIKDRLVERIVYECVDLGDGGTDVYYHLRPVHRASAKLADKARMLRVYPDHLDIFPFKPASSGTGYEPKYAGLAQLTLAQLRTGPYEKPATHDDVVDLLDRPPDWLERNPLNGLGFSSQDRFIAAAIGSLSTRVYVLIGGGRAAPTYEGGVYVLSEQHIKQLVKSMRSISSRYQRQARVDRMLVAHNELLSAVDPNRFPAKMKRASAEAVFEMVKVGRTRTRIPKEAQRGMVNMLADNAPAIAKEAPETLYDLAAKIESATLQEMIAKYREKLAQNLPETKWQSFFEANTFILSMAFVVPTIFVQETPYVHGKRVSGQGGRHSDFLMRGQGTGNVALIEIKAPGTKLLMQYRAEQQGPSNDLTGAITQVLGQRRRLSTGWASLKVDDDGTLDGAEIYSPQAVVLIGTLPTSRADKEAFDAFRHVLKDVTVLTFDELLARLEYLHHALAATPPVPNEPNDVPF